LYFPSHGPRPTLLVPWVADGQLIGHAREVSNPAAVWLMLHGNAGQAADRDYVLPRLSPQDALYVLEYPGYGQRGGAPGRTAIDQAAAEAYRWLRGHYPNTPVCVLAESIGSGPACTLAQATPPPDKIVLVVPFDTLANVAARHMPFLPVRLLLRDRWDNIEALRGYTGPLDIVASREDTVIPLSHALALARQMPQARWIEIPGGHNDWSEAEELNIRSGPTGNGSK
jgi:hypothetical protein